LKLEISQSWLVNIILMYERNGDN